MARRFALLLLLSGPLLLSPSFSLAGGEGTGPLRLRVLSYNIHHGEGVDGRRDLERIAGVIRSVDPDLVALQEVDQKTRRTDEVDQPAELARLTDMEVLFGPNIDFQGGGYGNAVLSKLPISSRQNHHLPSYYDGEQRGVLVVELEPPDGIEKLLFLATHLDYRSDDRERLASAKRINELIRTHGDAPAVLAGDLNATPESRVLEAFAEQWQRVNAEVLPTIPVDQPERQIDYILVRPKNRWKTIDVRVLDEAVASDHRAIFAILELER